MPSEFAIDELLYQFVLMIAFVGGFVYGLTLIAVGAEWLADKIWQWRTGERLPGKIPIVTCDSCAWHIPRALKEGDDNGTMYRG